MKKLCTFLIACCSIACCVSVAFADSNRGRGRELSACLRDANDVKKTCEASCRADHQTAVGQCTNREPSCVRGCRRNFRACVRTAEVPLDACRSACEPALRASRAQCRVDCNCRGESCERNSCFRACQAPAVLANFSCKQTCKDNFALDATAQAALAACATTRASCLTACSIVISPTPSPTPGN